RGGVAPVTRDSQRIGYRAPADLGHAWALHAVEPRRWRDGTTQFTIPEVGRQLAAGHFLPAHIGHANCRLIPLGGWTARRGIPGFVQRSVPWRRQTARTQSATSCSTG